MENRKRKADLQLTADEVDETNAPEAETLENGANSRETAPVESTPPVATGGFSGYAKVNPFAAAIANNTSKSPFGGFSSTSSGFGSAPRASAITAPPALTLPSPKSPKANPFSSPSPAHNPFMTIVENNDDLWRSMAKGDKLNPSEEISKSSAPNSESRSRKSPVFRTSFFGGNGHTTFSSVAANAPSSVFSSTSALGSTSSVFGSNPTGTGTGTGNATSSASTTAAGDDGEEEDGDDGEDADDQEAGGASPSNANQASMKIISLPENVKLVTGEENDECLLQMRAKLFRLNAHVAVPSSGSNDSLSRSSTAAGQSAPQGSKAAVDVTNVLAAVGKSSTTGKAAPASKEAEWVEVGIGPLKILRRKFTDGHGRLVMRREDKAGGVGTKLLLNARLDRLLTVSRQNDKMVQLICVNYVDVPVPGASSAGPKIGTYLIKTKTSDEADDLYSIVFDFVQRAKEESEQDDSKKAPPPASPAVNGDDGENKSPAKCSVPQALRSSSPPLPE